MNYQEVNTIIGRLFENTEENLCIFIDGAWGIEEEMERYMESQEE